MEALETASQALVRMTGHIVKLTPIGVFAITAAADMGDVMQIASIAENLKSDIHSMTPFCDKIIHLAEEFDFDGI